MYGLPGSLLLAFLAAAAIPLGAHLARIEALRPHWLQNELRHGVIAFGGGVLLAAVSLVLVPEGSRLLPPSGVALAFAGGGVLFFLFDLQLARRGAAASQLMAMLLDFIPEAVAMGAALATGEPIGLVLAMLIALQNLPEGFNAFREIDSTGRVSQPRILLSFWAMVLLGPGFAYLGYAFLAGHPSLIGTLMLTASGGIVYLTFQDIAPQAALERHWGPALGAVSGFGVGLIGHLLLH